MSNKLDKISAKIGPDLHPGESLLAAVKVTPRGSAESGILGAAGGMVGGVVGIAVGGKVAQSKQEAGSEERSAAGLDLGNEAQVLAGVTNSRLLMWKLSKLSGKPKELLAEIDLAGITTMTLGEGKLMGQSMPEIVCKTTDGAEFGLLVGKIHRKDAEALIAAASQ